MIPQITTRKVFLQSYADFQKEQTNFIISLIEEGIKRKKKVKFLGDKIVINLPSTIGGAPLDPKIVDIVVGMYSDHGDWTGSKYNYEGGVTIELYPFLYKRRA